MSKVTGAIKKAEPQAKKAAESAESKEPPAKVEKPKKEYKLQSRVNEATAKAKESPNRAREFGNRLRQNSSSTAATNKPMTSRKTGIVGATDIVTHNRAFNQGVSKQKNKALLKDIDTIW